MRDLKWYYWVAFILGGLAVVAIVYFVLRSTGALDRIAPRKEKWVEYEQ